MTRPLTARCGRYHEESDAGQLDKRSHHVSAPDAAGRPCWFRPWPIPEGVTGRERGPPSGVHNVTPREDYRTALLSDSPDTGCSLSFAWRRVDSETNPTGCASAVLRRSRRRRGRFSAEDEAVHGRPRVDAQNFEATLFGLLAATADMREGTAAFRPRARGTNLQPSDRIGVPPHA